MEIFHVQRIICTLLIKLCFYFFSGKSQGKKSAFRPAYSQLIDIRALVGHRTPFVCLTATATKKAIGEIIKSLSLSCSAIIIPPVKENVYYAVIDCVGGPKDLDGFQCICDMLKARGVNCGRCLIFFRRIKYLIEVYDFFADQIDEREHEQLFNMYHLSTPDKVKKCIRHSCGHAKGSTRVIMCSTSFSMGMK